MNTPMRIAKQMVFAGIMLGCAGLQVTAAELQVPADYPTIQAAVDAAFDGDTIRIAPGVYSGQVLIADKSLTLCGSPGAVLRATAGMSQPYLHLGLVWVPLVGILRSEVVVSNLTFEGEHLSDSQASVSTGIYYVGSSGRVEDCRITGFRGITLGGRLANGLRVVNPTHVSTNVVNIQILRNTFADNVVSISLIGDDRKSNDPSFDPTLLRTRCVVRQNTIIGNGPDAVGIQDGIDIYAGVTGEVSRNTITDHAYVGDDPTPFAFGIVAEDLFDFERGPLSALQALRFEGNVFRNNQIHLLVLRGDGSTIVNNTFDGTAPGRRPMGLGFSGENLLVARNHFHNVPLGILLFGDDPEFGSYLGIANNARLTANRFCDVSTNLLVEASASKIEEGTLTCPFPPPTLTIEPAVLVSWPAEDDGWTLESAPGVDGPWAPVSATPFIQSGRQNIAVPTESRKQFFRAR